MRVSGRFKRDALPKILALVVFAVFTIALLKLSGVRINLTDSLPMGIYVTTSDENAALIEFCPGGASSVLSVGRGYRPHGICPDTAAPLLKPIIANSGDIVVVSADGLSVNGNLLLNTAARQYDSAGRALTAWRLGTYSVPPAMIWVASTYHPNSFDSRYFGPIPVSLIRHRVRPLWVLRTTPNGLQ